MKKIFLNISLIVIFLSACSPPPPVKVKGLTDTVIDMRISVEACRNVSLLLVESSFHDIDLPRMAKWAMNYLIHTLRKELNFEPVFRSYLLRCPPIRAGNHVGLACGTDVRLFYERYYMRDNSDSQMGKDVEEVFRKRILVYVHADRTVIAHPGSYNKGDIHNVYKKVEYIYHVWGATKILFAVVGNYRCTHHQEFIDIARRIMLHLKQLAVYPTPDCCYFPAGLGAMKHDVMVVSNSWNLMPSPVVIPFVNDYCTTRDVELLAFAKAYAEGIMTGSQPYGVRFGTDDNLLDGHSHATMLWGINKTDHSYFTNTKYLTSEDKADKLWKELIGQNGFTKIRKAELIEFQARDAFYKVAAMEVIATKDETARVIELSRNPDCLFFTEDRENSIVIT